MPEMTLSGIPVLCRNCEAAKLADLHPNPRNPNKHAPEQIDLLAKIIRASGWRHPIIVSKRSGLIVAGHCRYLAAQKLGVEEVPIERQWFATDEDELAFLLADNRIAELAERDNTAIKDLLEQLDTGAMDMDLTGYSQKALESLMTQVAPEPNPEAERPQGDDVLTYDDIVEDNPKLGVLTGARLAYRDRMSDKREVNFWLCLVFQNYEQKKEFLAQFEGLETLYDMYVDGVAFAQKIGKPVTVLNLRPIVPPPPDPNLSKLAEDGGNVK